MLSNNLNTFLLFSKKKKKIVKDISIINQCAKFSVKDTD